MYLGRSSFPRQGNKQSKSIDSQMLCDLTSWKAQKNMATIWDMGSARDTRRYTYRVHTLPLPAISGASKSQQLTTPRQSTPGLHPRIQGNYGVTDSDRDGDIQGGVDKPQQSHPQPKNAILADCLPIAECRLAPHAIMNN